MLIWLTSAFAQAPVVIGNGAEIVYIKSTTEAAKSKRFATDATMTGPVFDPAGAVRVLIRENGWVRVRSGDEYGWVPQAVVVAKNPKGSPLRLNIPGMGN